MGVRQEDELSCIEAFDQGVFLMPCNACRRDRAYTDLGLPEDGLLVSTSEVVGLLKHRREIHPRRRPHIHYAQKAGIYFPGDSIDLIEATAWEGEATLMNLDGARAEIAVQQGGGAILLQNLGQNPHWEVSDGRGYVEEQNGTFVEMGDGN